MVSCPVFCYFKLYSTEKKTIYQCPKTVMILECQLTYNLIDIVVLITYYHGFLGIRQT